jgi:hypothetical protein
MGGSGVRRSTAEDVSAVLVSLHELVGATNVAASLIDVNVLDFSAHDNDVAVDHNG